MNCHRTHSAGRGPRLLARALETENCTVCHAGNVAQKNVADEFAGGNVSDVAIRNFVAWA